MLEFSTKESQMIHGDALNLLPKLPKSSVRLLLTDPPYNVSRKNNLQSMNRKGVSFGNWDVGFDQLEWITLAEPSLMPGASIIIWNDWKNLGSIANFLESIKIIPKRMLTLVKSNPFPRNLSRSFVQATEHALWAVKAGDKWVFNKSKDKGYENGVFRAPVQKASHPTKKSDALFEEIISILSNENDLILDPFVGGGTTAYAAEKLNRKHISFEKDNSYYREAVRHWNGAKIEGSIGKIDGSNPKETT